MIYFIINILFWDSVIRDVNGPGRPDGFLGPKVCEPDGLGWVGSIISDLIAKWFGFRSYPLGPLHPYHIIEEPNWIESQDCHDLGSKEIKWTK